MKKIISLDKLNINENAKILYINDNSNLKQRFLDLGIYPKSLIKCEFISPFKDPHAYLIKGCTIAIRNEDAKDIKVIVNE